MLGSQNNVLESYYNINIEQHILSILINHNAAYDDISNILIVDLFYIESHKLIYECIQKMLNNGQRADILSIMHVLNNKIDAKYISEITNIYISMSSIIQYVDMLKELYLRRHLYTTIKTLETKLNNNDSTEECWSAMEQSIIHINSKTNNASIVNFSQINQTILKEIKHSMDNPKSIMGIDTGFIQLNELTGGFKPGELIILAGRPSVGKTAFAINMAIACAKNKKNGGGVLFISLEMTPGQIGKRILASLSSIPLNNFTHGYMNKSNFQLLVNVVNNISNIPFFIYDSFILNIPKLRSLLRQYKRIHNIELIVVDYLQLITSVTKYTSREQEVSDISRSLKLIAKELNLPILALSQMSRDIEKRQTNNTPRLSDLRSSGAIEQDADVILFLFRHTNNDIEDRTKIICHIAKNRNGPLGDILLHYSGETTTFTEYDATKHMHI